MSGGPVDAQAEISAREADVLALLGEHLTNAEIGERLFISARTVESHVASLLRKLGAKDRRVLAAVATARAADAGDATASSPSRPRRLPAPLTRFVGRRAERGALVAAVGEHRLVTVVGPGGVGKTRLALEVGRDLAGDFPAGVWYVDLVPVTDPVTVAAAVATAAGLGEQLGRSPMDTLVTRFQDARALLVLDNCEHVVHGVARLVESLLAACPDLHVLATSQARLVVPHERPFPVEGMSTDADGGDAVALFAERAEKAGWMPDEGAGGAIAALCAALEGNALAIELAAARVGTLGLDGLEAGLHDRLALLSGGSRATERHGSLRSAVAWSDGLLSPVDQAVLRRCSIFAAPFQAAAAIDVVVDETIGAVDVIAALGRLADHSLLVVVPRADGTRYRMLETIRQYGHERLHDLAETAQVRARHVGWCTSVVGARLDGSAGAVVDDAAAEARAALAWSGDRAEDRREAHRLALGFAELLFDRGLRTEAQRRYEQAAVLATDDHATARALHVAAIVAACRLVGDDAVRLHRAAAAAARRAGDGRAAALDLLRAAEFFDRFAGLVTTAPPPGEAAGLVAEARELAPDDDDVAAAAPVAMRDDVDPAEADAVIGPATRSHDPWLQSAALDWRIALELGRGDPVAACATVDRRFQVLAQRGDDMELAFELTDALHTATLAHLGAGRLDAARGLIERRRGVPFLQGEDDLALEAWTVAVDALRGEWDDVLALDEASFAAVVRAKRMYAMETALPPAAAAMVHGLRGDELRRRRWLDLVDAVVREHPRGHAETDGYGPVLAATVALHRGEHAEAVVLLAAEPTTLDSWQAGVWRQWYAALWAEAGVAAGVADAADRVATAQRITHGNPVASAIVERTAALVAGDASRLRAAAATLAAAGARYQHARTLVLAGGAARDDGARMLDELGATPMDPWSALPQMR